MASILATNYPRTALFWLSLGAMVSGSRLGFLWLWALIAWRPCSLLATQGSVDSTSVMGVIADFVSYQLTYYPSLIG